MRTRTKILIAVGSYVVALIVLAVAFGSAGKNDEFQPQNEFKLPSWVEIKVFGVDMSINRAVLYLFLGTMLTIVTMTWIARRMQQKPNRVQMAVETAYDLTHDNIVGQNLEGKYATKWFPFCATLFFFIWFANMLGYVPLPTNTEETVNIFGLAVPTFSLYAATANISIPLMLTIMVWFSYNIEGIRSHGFFGYFKTWLPPGLEEMNPFGKAAIFGIEVISHFVRLDLALRATFREHPRRPPPDPLHGRRARRSPRVGGAGRADVPNGVCVLHLRGRPDRDPAGIHLLDPHRYLPGRRDLRESLDISMRQETKEFIHG